MRHLESSCLVLAGFSAALAVDFLSTLRTPPWHIEDLLLASGWTGATLLYWLSSRFWRTP